MRITFDWAVSPYFGWGVYGLNLALEWARDPEVEARTSAAISLDGVDALRRRCLGEFNRRSLAGRGEDLRLCALGNELVGNDGRVGVVFFEQPLSPAAIEKAKRFDLIITGSSWNDELLRQHGVRTAKVLQGVDPTIFRPAPKRGLFPRNFVIFSGGKAEPRKGQDLVVEAFRIFAAKRPEAILVTGWHSPWPELARGMNVDVRTLGDKVIDVGQVPNALMPAIYRECDVGLFPNRAEGGTNLVAMECMACGVPVILSDNTGHQDLMGRQGVRRLTRQTLDALGRGDSDVDEIVALLENAVACAWAPQMYSPIEDLTWRRTAHELKAAIAPLVSSQGVAA